MLVIYWKSDGEIFEVASGYTTMKDFYGRRFEEFSTIFDYIYIEDHNDYFFNRYIDFLVIEGKLVLKESDGLIKLLN